ncbi:ABC transporter substrate-binding protein [uncultured Algibacter sp.]|uniref:type IX secretion system anionic LPS delivery protein PorZ n=1 Tax=uncultured Algibacter sp. TaxID=298659 RepID=UPI002617B453|nr:ABC transporter substrate-binding protein [uncultured Algibacter sp.]
MFKRFIVLLICLFPLLHFSQDFSASWKGHFSYNNIKDVSQGNGKIYASADNSIFILDTQTNEIEELTAVNGLSGEAISSIFYSDIYELLVIGYENGLIEIVFDNDNKVLAFVDILDKPTISPTSKRINHFNADQNVVYISTNYGITVLHLERLEFGDTYFIGNGGAQIPVTQTAIYKDFIYASTIDNNGLKKADISRPDLIDFKNWETISSGNWNGVEAHLDRLYATNFNRIIYEVENGSVKELFTYATIPLDLRSVDQNLVVTTENDVSIYDINFNLISNITANEDYKTKFNVATINKENSYIGTELFGLLKTEVSNVLTFQEIHPDGPLLNTPFSLESLPNGVWVSFGDYSNRYNPSPVKRSGVSHLRSNRWKNIPYDSLFGSRNLNTISINPYNNEQVFINSFLDGILEIVDDQPVIRYDQTNSGLESIEMPGDPDFTSLRLSGSAFDENGVLWTTTCLIAKPLKSFDLASNSWRSYDFSSLISDPINQNLGFSDLIVDEVNQVKWIGSFNFGLIGFIENNGRPLIKSISSEDENFPFYTVTALASDKRNQLWIGTTLGLRVLYNTSNFFEDENIRVDEIIIEEDGIAKELLFQQNITDIKVDGSNNKWIGTSDSGLFYFSPDGQKTIFHFTKDNSPLPTNSIRDLSIDEVNGIIYIATEKGLLSFKSGSSGPVESLDKAFVYPNPVRPEFNVFDKKVKIKDISENVNIKITDIEGNLVAEAQSKTNPRYGGYNLEIDGGTAYWNGRNLGNNMVASGVYLIMLSDLDTFETKVIKLMVVR